MAQYNLKVTFICTYVLLVYIVEMQLLALVKNWLN